MLEKESIAKILQWNKIHAVALILLTVISLLLESTVLLAVVSLLSFCYFVYFNRGTWQTLKPFGGYANWVTGFRLIMIFFLMVLWPIMPNLLFIVLMVTFAVLDGIDGKLARKYKQESIFGEYFDMELDALFVLFSCLVLYLKGYEGIWILIPGLLRYIFVIYVWLFSAVPKKDKKQRFATIIAGVFFMTLLVSLAFQNIVQEVILILSSIAIVVSFGISFYQFDYGRVEA